MTLQYAPPARSPSRVIHVVAAGLITTVLALVGVWSLETYARWNVMGLHANYVIPIGAIVVGVVASSGYGIASYVTGLKIRKGLLWTILLLQVCAYFAAQYVTFASMGPLVSRSTGKQLTFPEYFHFNATHFAWKKEHGEGYGEALGNAGYFFIGLEVLGFALGSLIVPGVLMKRPYCELCQAYMKHKRLATMPASVPARKVDKKDASAAAAYQAEQAQAAQAAQARMQQFAKLAEAGDAPMLRNEIDSMKPGSKAAGKLPVRVTLDLYRCPCCSNGHVQPMLVSGQGNKAKSTPMPKIEVSREFLRQFDAPAPNRAGRGAPAPLR
jgi:hypothetical protein